VSCVGCSGNLGPSGASSTAFLLSCGGCGPSTGAVGGGVTPLKLIIISSFIKLTDVLYKKKHQINCQICIQNVKNY
jgi:hypothetical protein